MADDKMNTPESPENWQEYSRLLQGMPGMNVPEGFESRLDARMKQSGRRNNGRRAIIWRVVAPAFSIAAILMVIVLSSLPDSAPAPARTVITNPSSAPEKRPARRTPRLQRRVQEPPQPAATSLPRLVDTSHPRIVEPPTPGAADRRTPAGHGTEEPIVTGGRRKQ